MRSFWVLKTKAVLLILNFGVCQKDRYGKTSLTHAGDDVVSTRVK